MFVNRLGVVAMTDGPVSTGRGGVEGVLPTALWPLAIGINTGHRPSTTWYMNILGVVLEHPFSDLM